MRFRDQHISTHVVKVLNAYIYPSESLSRLICSFQFHLYLTRRLINLIYCKLIEMFSARAVLAFVMALFFATAIASELGGDLVNDVVVRIIISQLCMIDCSFKIKARQATATPVRSATASMMTRMSSGAAAASTARSSSSSSASGSVPSGYVPSGVTGSSGSGNAGGSSGGTGTSSAASGIGESDTCKTMSLA